MSSDTIALAEAFLAEAVFRSRGSQAGAAFFAAGAQRAAGGSGDDPSLGCGLGQKAAVVLDLTPRAQELFDELFDGGEANLDQLHAVMTRWIQRQDALDRKRNHFLRDFRAEHGADRRDYAPAVLDAYNGGLEAVNASVADERQRVAADVVACRKGGSEPAR